MKLIENEKIMCVLQKRQELLTCIQTFSDYFQRTILLRLALTDNTHFKKSAQQHFDEENGHNVTLSNERNLEAPKWDAILAACAAWFSWNLGSRPSLSNHRTSDR